MICLMLVLNIHSPCYRVPPFQDLAIFLHRLHVFCVIFKIHKKIHDKIEYVHRLQVVHSVLRDSLSLPVVLVSLLW